MAKPDSNTSITDDQLRELENNPPAQVTEFSVPRHKGLRVKQYPSGVLTFLWYYRLLGKQRKLSLGRFEKGNRLEDVADKLATARDTVAMGHDPQQPHGDKITTVADLAAVFYKDLDPHGYAVHRSGEEPPFQSSTAKIKYPGAVYRLLYNEILPAIGKFKIKLVEPHMLAALIDDKAKGRGRYAGRPAPTHARRMMTVLNQLFRFAVARGWIPRNPIMELRPGDMALAGKARDRHLDPQEIKVLWNVLEGEHPTYRAAMRLLLLTGVRGIELREAVWADVDFTAKTWTIPIENQKTAGRVANPQPFVIPLTELAIDAFRMLQQQTGEQGKHVLLNPLKYGRRMGAASLRHRSYDIATRHNMTRWAPHDLRRTFRSGLSDCRVDFAIAEKCVNHSLGKMAETYDRSGMFEQRKDALQRWEKRLAVYLSDDEKITVLAS